MAATLLEILNIIALGILAGTGTGLFIGFVFRKQTSDWASMTRRDILINLALVAFCSAVFMAAMAWYLYVYKAPQP